MFEELARAYRYWHATGDRVAYVCDRPGCLCNTLAKGCVRVVQSLVTKEHDHPRGKGELLINRAETF